MLKIKIDIDQQKLTKDSKIISQRMKYYTFKYGDVHIEKIKLLNKPLCILIFDSDNTNVKIDNLYVAKQFDFMTNNIETNSILIEYDHGKHESPIDAVFGFIQQYFNIPTDTVSLENMKVLERIYYIGTLRQQHYLYVDIPCYAIDIKDFTKQLELPIQVDDLNYITPIKYKELINNGSHDSILAAAVFMLIAYFT